MDNIVRIAVHCATLQTIGVWQSPSLALVKLEDHTAGKIIGDGLQ